MIPTIPVFSAEEIQQLDRLAQEKGIAGQKMMQKAGEEIAKALIRFADAKSVPHQLHVVIGKGNNGGDGLVAAIELHQKGWQVEVYTCFSENSYSSLSLHFQEKWKKLGKSLHPFPRLVSFDQGIILDGIFGVGFKGPVEAHVQKIISQLNQSSLPIISIDIPSGMDGNTGFVDSVAIKARRTLSLGCPKIGYYLEQGIAYTGEIECLDYGMPAEISSTIEFSYSLLDLHQIQRIIPIVDPTVHKYTKGYLLVIGGSKGMYGAPKLSTLAALRTGCGIVRFYYPDQDRNDVGEMPLEVIHEPMSDRKLESFCKEQERAGAVLIGPGINPGASSSFPLTEIAHVIKKPLILDGGGLSFLPLFIHQCPQVKKIITPHLGEAIKLLGLSSSPSCRDLINNMQDLCDAQNLICVLKGPVTFLISPHEVPIIIPYGSPALATAGSGDVLAGIISAFIAKGLSLIEGAALGTVLHQMAGNEARDTHSEEGVIASDIIEAIPHAYTKLSSLK